MEGNKLLMGLDGAFDEAERAKEKLEEDRTAVRKQIEVVKKRWKAIRTDARMRFTDKPTAFSAYVQAQLASAEESLKAETGCAPALPGRRKTCPVLRHGRRRPPRA